MPKLGDVVAIPFTIKNLFGAPAEPTLIGTLTLFSNGVEQPLQGQAVSIATTSLPGFFFAFVDTSDADLRASGFFDYRKRISVAMSDVEIDDVEGLGDWLQSSAFDLDGLEDSGDVDADWLVSIVVKRLDDSALLNGAKITFRRMPSLFVRYSDGDGEASIWLPNGLGWKAIVSLFGFEPAEIDFDVAGDDVELEAFLTPNSGGGSDVAGTLRGEFIATVRGVPTEGIVFRYSCDVAPTTPGLAVDSNVYTATSGPEGLTKLTNLVATAGYEVQDDRQVDPPFNFKAPASDAGNVTPLVDDPAGDVGKFTLASFGYRKRTV